MQVQHEGLRPACRCSMRFEASSSQRVQFGFSTANSIRPHQSRFLDPLFMGPGPVSRGAAKSFKDKIKF